MATPVPLPFSPATTPTVVIPTSGVSEWVDAILAGTLDVDDLEGEAVVIEDATWIDTDGHSEILERAAGVGTILWIRLVYDKDDEAQSESLVIRVFGAHSDQPSGTPFVALTNQAGQTSVAIPTKVTDDSIYDGNRYTTLDNILHAFDCKNYTYFLIGIEKVYNGASAGSTAKVQAMIT